MNDDNNKKMRYDGVVIKTEWACGKSENDVLIIRPRKFEIRALNRYINHHG